MLGKQWLNRYLRHTGGSIVERCGDRQRKFNGLEKWSFRLFIEGLPIMLQIALFLLACGLSRYMWSVNASVAWVVISFTLTGLLFYIGIVVAGTSSYECPFQTPVSIALRHLKDSGTTHKLLSRPSPLAVISLIPIIWRKSRKLLMILSSLIRRSSTWKFFQSQILSAIHDAARNVGHRAIILFLKMDGKFRDAKLWMAQGVRRFMRAGLLPTSTKDVNRVRVTPRNGQGLRSPVRDLETVRRQNTDNAGCVCWVLRNITDPEALDAAIRLAGTIRWFDGDPDHNPPFDVIVSAFEACSDSAKQLYPGMRDRAYFSARAILQISLGARVRSHEHASKYPVPNPTISSTPFRSTDVDLYHVVRMLKENTGGKLTLRLPLPKSENTRAHSLWLSNLLVDLTRSGPKPFWEDYEYPLDVAKINHRPTIANLLVMWYMLLGGQVEEGTFWAVDKSYAVVSLFLLPAFLAPHTQCFIGSYPLQLVSEGDGGYCRWAKFRKSPRSVPVFGSVGGPPHFFDPNGLPMVFCYL